MSLVFVLSCSESEPPRDRTLPDSRKTEKEWFWRDRLSTRPEPLQELDCPLPTKKILADTLEELKGSTPHQAEKFVTQWVEVGEPLIDPLSSALQDESRVVRWAAVASMSRIGGPRCIEPLLHALYDEWDAPAILAASHLRNCNEIWALPRLIKTLGPFPIDFNPHLMVRVIAASALIRMGNYSGVPFLIKILKDNTPAQDPERDWVSTTRLAWEKEEAFKELKRLTNDGFGFHVDAPLTLQAEAALRFEAWWEAHRLERWRSAPGLTDPLLKKKINDLVSGLSSYQARNADGAKYCLKMLGPPVFPFLAEAVRSGGFYEKFHSLDIIAELASLAVDGREAWADVPTAALKDEAPAIRMKAAKALGHLKASSSLPDLEETCSDPDPDVRLASVEAIGFIGGPRAEAFLKGLLGKNNPAQMEIEAKAALARMAPSYVEPFLEELLLEDTNRREWALQKTIDLIGDDCGFSVDGPLSERTEAVGRIREKLNNSEF